nr:immunoglobulin light chain junction region [Macaca mulatta]MOW08359.1 immunoglobulin light chain junction region [Macaca mulatta]MOW08831.1 immunoglobulin light chain junction region [Macaca mulatta]MOW09611.1 immunoglobulin light chain junction region [Macaca mulatta]MOW10036.1 immunoglobulin light chain junction region [Macaca mulatta]
CQKYITTPLTF